MFKRILVNALVAGISGLAYYLWDGPARDKEIVFALCLAIGATFIFSFYVLLEVNDLEKKGRALKS